ncbi:glutamine--tRNA ligase/YqeY domain fusion protein [Enhygromyxa salina]|uniref:Glutamine--tRNA ligase n=1 Tax=Enhygromyxa salina TaxID=215803 RepID=A0A2S9Y870_9BACT|nr:glutamine--tRNA ligase/YqeY domain fusion protein [Enhygromyxa salina]PRQ01295.1 Glutamine--tRNA ligase [Enhygromyxa salina]
MTKHDDALTEPRDNFIIDAVAEDLAAGRYTRPVCTRFPPEPNGYMHLGHAKGATIAYGVAQRFGGLFNLRMDDTNPAAEDQVFVDAMIEDVAWLLGCDLEGRVFYASDYFDQLYQYALQLIDKDLAYVEELTLEQIREYRGNFFKPGRPSPWRDRPVADSRRLFEEMKAGQHAPGSLTLRAKIDPAHGNMNMRDPVLYRILDQTHHRAGPWRIYPMYDYAHPLSDAIEGVTHSTCGKEFADHRPLYDWCLANVDIVEPPRQIEYAEIGITGVVLAKRHLRKLVESGVVERWDDPRLPTVRGLRRRGVPAEAIVRFCEELGVSDGSPGSVDTARLEATLRDYLNAEVPRVMGILNPLKVTIENIPEGQVEQLDAPFMPDSDAHGSRSLPFSREIYIDRDDFMKDPPKKYYRLAPGREVRLRYAYVLACTEVIEDPETGEVLELRGTIDPDTKGKNPADGRKIKGTIHWIDAGAAVPAEVRLYTNLFTDALEAFDGSQAIQDYVDPSSLELVTGALVEPSLRDAKVGHRVQFERVGYFAVDPDSESAGHLVFNRTATLRDNKFKKIFKG